MLLKDVSLEEGGTVISWLFGVGWMDGWARILGLIGRTDSRFQQVLGQGFGLDDPGLAVALGS
jgi:hypothetical protein